MADAKKSNQLLQLKQLQDQLMKMGTLSLNGDKVKENAEKGKDTKSKPSREELRKRLRNRTNMMRLQRQTKQSKQNYIDKKTEATGQKINISDFEKLKLNKDTLEKLKKYVQK